MTGPNPDVKYPIKGYQGLQYIKNTITKPNIIVGDYSYYDCRNGDFEDQVLHHYEMYGDQLIIGKFCSIASGVTFIMNGANHKMDGFSTYPFNIFGHGWERFTPSLEELPFKGDTVIGNDVWLGMDACIMPGVKIGDGAIIAAKSVVTKDVQPYTIVGGNPSKELRKRFTDDIIATLLNVAWWEWDIEKISNHIDIIVNGDSKALLQVK
ncbi:Vat family streptogramin A O-acetyltransferase [Brevibacillus laterosporus]|uniref:Vat family streptogramin A O-acetyltransferase n=1 Tax=Brevibacillus laterosporus TaxID=1465 RepID=UPI003D190706